MMDSKGDKNDLYLPLISAMSHDVVGPMRWVLNLLDVLAKDDSLSQKQRQDYLMTAVSSLRGSLHTMESVLDFSRRMSISDDKVGGYQEFELFPLLSKTVDAISLAYDFVDIELDCPKDIRLRSERVILEIALENIIVNAAKYSSGDSDVFVSVKPMDCSVTIRVVNSAKNISPKLISSLNQGKPIARDSRVSIGVFVSKKLLETIGAELRFSYQEPEYVVAEIVIKGACI